MRTTCGLSARRFRVSKLVMGDFALCLEWAARGDLVYLDPPYHPRSATASFTSYTLSDFGVEDQQRLARLFRDLDQRGCRVLLSNSATTLVRDLYSGYEQIEVEASRAISSKGDGRGAIVELLVTNHREAPSTLDPLVVHDRRATCVGRRICPLLLSVR